MSRWIILPILLILGLVLTTTVYPSTQISFHIIIYGDPRCPHCRATYDYLSSLYGSSNVLFCDIVSNNTCRICYESIVRDFFGGYEAVPVTLFYYNGTITGIVMGEISNSTLSSPSLLSNFMYYNRAGIVKGYVAVNGGLVEVSNVTAVSQQALLEKYDVYFYTPSPSSVSQGTVNTVNIISIIPSLIILSLLDSVNPCELAIFFSFTVAALGGRRRSYGPPLVFIILVYLGYMLLGLGLYQFARLVNPIPLAIIALVIGVYNTIRPEEVSGERLLKCSWCERVGIRFQSGVSYITAIVLALISVTILLPCTAGPYAAFIVLLRNMSLIQAVALLIAYNAIFITPFVIILLIAREVSKQKKLARWISKNSSMLNFLTGLALIFISIYVIFTTV
ncbi:hypothetical protein ACSU1N_00345 [Thermogladius sp. 4427co]|uniref:hypothetical protein n=1 Tax=Thermogladius sp. 4427co TaxID=3450718 RepID=UPI003F7959CF